MAASPRPAHIYAMAAAVGLAAYFIVYGPVHLLGLGSYWELPQPDERMAMMGYRYFLHEGWHWPLFASHTIDVTRTTSVAFWDCIPLWALVNKAIATVIPPWRSFSEHAYLGLWHGLAYALQPCFGVAILRALGHRSWRESVATAVMFVALPTWIYRYGHAALSAHWILLWAILEYVRGPRRAAIAQLAVAALVTPYLAVMSLGVFVASMLRSRGVRWIPLGLAVVTLASWLAGYFDHEARIHQWGFEKESANALSWLVPVRSGIIGDGRWLANVMATPWQYEGYAYLGLGILGLFALFAPHARQLRSVIARHRYLFAIALAFAVFALSNHIYVGSHELVAYPIPHPLRWIPQQFRSPGRFVWIPTYVLVAFLLHWAFWHFAQGKRFAVVAAALAIQLVDVRAEWALQRDLTAAGQHAIAAVEPWRRLLASHRAVMVYPTHHCIGEPGDAEAAKAIALDIAWLASERALPINGSYNTRPTHACAEDPAVWPTIAFQPDTLYVLLPQATAIADRFQAAGASCGAFEHGRACSADAGAIADAIAAGILRPPPPPLGLPIDLADVPGLTPAWSEPEAGGRWTVDALASLLVRAEPSQGASLKLRAAARLCGARQAQDVDVLIDGAVAGTLHFDPATNDRAIDRSIALSSPPRSVFALVLRPHDTRSPAKLGCDGDARALGVWVARIWLE